MPVARLEAARALELEGPGGALEVRVAEGFRLRLLGLARLAPDEIHPLLFLRCRSLHTFWMRSPIDVVWLLGTGGTPRPGWTAEVIGAEAEVRPKRTLRAPRIPGARGRICALELPGGGAGAHGLVPGATLRASASA